MWVGQTGIAKMDTQHSQSANAYSGVSYITLAHIVPIMNPTVKAHHADTTRAIMYLNSLSIQSIMLYQNAYSGVYCVLVYEYGSASVTKRSSITK